MHLTKQCRDCRAAVEPLAQGESSEAYRCGRCHPCWIMYNRKKGARYRAANAEVERERGRRSYQRHGEQRRADARAYNQSERGRSNKKRWHEENPDKIRANRRAAYDRRVARNPNFGKEARDRRRARLKKAQGSHTHDEWSLVIEGFDHKCAYCSSTKSLVKDHLIPLCRGGTDWSGNLVPACAECNGIKGGRTPEEAIKLLADAEHQSRLHTRLATSRALPGNNERHAYMKVSTECLLAEARRITHTFGKITAQLLNERSRYASSTFERRFGGMRGLKEKLAG